MRHSVKGEQAAATIDGNRAVIGFLEGRRDGPIGQRSAPG